MATGTVTVNFGAFPGSYEATAIITGQTGIATSSLVEAWLYPKATSDHSEDEHIYENFNVMVPSSTIVAGTGFTIRCYVTGNQLLYGQYTVNWVWV